MSITELNRSFAEARALGQSLKPSRRWQPMKLTDQPGALDKASGKIAEVWENHLYCTNVWRLSAEEVVIGLFSHDGEARHDWRDFQRVKNDVVGREWEAIELYPAESRLIDTSNYYYLYCRPRFHLGKQIGRQILWPERSLAPQRPWHSDDAPVQILAERPT